MENLNHKDLLIVVPYRNREEHLKDFLENTPKYFDNQNLNYDILICELDQKGDWNAGLCVNSLIKFIEKIKTEYKYLYIHHVDVWPISGDWVFPKDNEVYFNMGDYGSCLLTMKAFLDAQGYSNSFWGWGGEDNELYNRLREKQYKVNEISHISNIKYETKHQSHERKFNGKNYANAIKQFRGLARGGRTDIVDFDNHGYAKNLIQLKKNIFKQIVYPKQKSPNETINSNLILTYVTNTEDFNKFISYVKSAQIHASYEFDMAAIVTTKDKNCWCVNQLTTFGIECIFPENKIENKLKLFEQFIVDDKRYNFILTVPIENLFFQLNPFDFLDPNCLTIVSKKNSIFAGPKKDFLKCCKDLLENNISINNTNNINDNFYVDLSLIKNANILQNKKVVDNDQKKYAIVLNYHFHPSLQQTVDNHFKQYYDPL
jgi:hypothetical protein